jgi:hypothetical protein
MNRASFRDSSYHEFRAPDKNKKQDKEQYWREYFRKGREKNNKKKSQRYTNKENILKENKWPRKSSPPINQIFQNNLEPLNLNKPKNSIKHVNTLGVLKENENQINLLQSEISENSYNSIKSRSRTSPKTEKITPENFRRFSWGIQPKIKNTLNTKKIQKSPQNSKSKISSNHQNTNHEGLSTFTLGSLHSSTSQITKKSFTIPGASNISAKPMLHPFMQGVIPEIYSNDDPRINSIFEIYRNEKMQKNGTIFSKIVCLSKGKVAAANNANVFEFGETSRGGFDGKIGKGRFVLQGNFQEVLGMWRMDRNSRSREDKGFSEWGGDGA